MVPGTSTETFGAEMEEFVGGEMMDEPEDEEVEDEDEEVK
jgi:hypothetical protein